MIFKHCEYVYILSRQKLIKIAKNGPFWQVFENLKLAVKQCYQTSHFFIVQKLVKNAKISILNETFIVISKHCVYV